MPWPSNGHRPPVENLSRISLVLSRQQNGRRCAPRSRSSRASARLRLICVRERVRRAAGGRRSKFLCILVNYRRRCRQGLVSAGTTRGSGLSSALASHSRAVLPTTAPSCFRRSRACASNELGAPEPFVRAAEMWGAKYSIPRELEAGRRLDRSGSSSSSNKAFDIYINHSRGLAHHPEV